MKFQTYSYYEKYLTNYIKIVIFSKKNPPQIIKYYNTPKLSFRLAMFLKSEVINYKIRI